MLHVVVLYEAPHKLVRTLKYYEEHGVKGEFVLVIEGKHEGKQQDVSLKEALKFAKMLMEKGEKPATASKKAAKVFGLKKSIIYNDIVEKQD